MKKLLFITARLPYPASSGRKNVMYNYCRLLHSKYNYEITVASFMEQGDVVNPVPDFIKEVIVLPSISGKKKLVNLVKETFLLRRYPMQVSLFYDKTVVKYIKNIIDRIEPDVVMCDMVRTTEYARDYSGYKIADLDDMISIRYERQLEMDLKDINPYGAYLYSLPEKLQRVLNITAIKKFILKNEINLLKKYEKEISEVYSRTVFVAEGEAARLNRLMNFEKAVAIPLGVDTAYYSEFYGKIEQEPDTVAFLGAMSVAHNEAGAIHFIENILPKIVQKKPNVKFVIVGGGVTDKVKKLVNKNIVLTGRVDDVRTAVGKCSAFVCPLTFGSGIKTKNLEAMAMGVPVITTTIGAENISAIDGKDWIVADDTTEFANQVIRVLSDKALHDELAANAKRYVENNFTWDVAENKMNNVF